MDTRTFSIGDLNANLYSIAGKPKFTTQSISTTPKDLKIAELKRLTKDLHMAIDHK